MKSLILGRVIPLALALFSSCANRESSGSMAAPTESPGSESKTMGENVVKSEAEWKQELTAQQFDVLRKKGTEAPFTGKYWNQKDDGTYVCAGCGTELFTSADKFDAGCGWPSYTQAVDDGRIIEHEDTTHGMTRTEVVCAKCGGHLGHVFDDGPLPTGKRYCINSASLDFKKAK